MADTLTYEADDRLLPLLEQVERDGELIITREGFAVAKLVPAEGDDRCRLLMEKARALREQIAARGERFSWEELKTWRDEDRP